MARVQRKSLRRRLSRLVRIGTGPDPLLASTRDIGSGGIFVETPFQPPLKSKIELEVVLFPNQPGIRVKGIVVRLASAAEHPGFVLRFTPCEGATQIAEWIVKDIEDELGSRDLAGEPGAPAAGGGAPAAGLAGGA